LTNKVGRIARLKAAEQLVGSMSTHNGRIEALSVHKRGSILDLGHVDEEENEQVNHVHVTPEDMESVVEERKSAEVPVNVKSVHDVDPTPLVTLKEMKQRWVFASSHTPGFKPPDNPFLQTSSSSRSIDANAERVALCMDRGLSVGVFPTNDENLVEDSGPVSVVSGVYPMQFTPYGSIGFLCWVVDVGFYFPPIVIFGYVPLTLARFLPTLLSHFFAVIQSFASKIQDLALGVGPTNSSLLATGDVKGMVMVSETKQEVKVCF